jgi:NAD(P)H-flavin reductase
MTFRQVSVASTTMFAPDLGMIVFDQDSMCKAGRFLQIWLPGIGEKPFAQSHERPLAIVVRAVGKMTRALLKMDVGTTLFIRGPCK